MNKIDEKLKIILEERETILAEMNEIKKAYDIRQQRLIEITGSIKILQELITDEQEEENKDINTTEN